MPITEEDREALIKVRIENAKSTLEDASQLLKSGSLRGAANRIYYAMFYAVSALAISQGLSFRKHTTLISFFQKEFSKTGIFDRKHGRALQKAFEDRSEADYQDYMKLTNEQIALRMNEATELIDAVDSYIKKSY